MTPARRWLVLILLLLATIVFIAFDRQSPQSAAIVDAVAPRPKAQAPADGAAGTARESDGSMIMAIRPRSAAGDIDDAFATRDWRPPPPPPPKPIAQASVMVAPQLP